MRRLYSSSIFGFLLTCVIFAGCREDKKETVEYVMASADSVLSDCMHSDEDAIRVLISKLNNMKAESKDVHADAMIDEYVRKLKACNQRRLIGTLEYKYNSLMHNAFSDVDDAVRQAQELLNRLSTLDPKELDIENRNATDSWRIHTAEVLSSFLAMKQNVFYEDPSKTDLSALRQRIALYGKDFKKSSYETVRMSWKVFCIEALKNQARVDLMHASEQLPELLKAAAIETAENSISGFVVNHKVAPKPLKGFDIKRYAKELKIEGTGTFFIYMKGNIFGIERGSVKVEVKILLQAVNDRNNIPEKIVYSVVDATIFDKTGDLR